MVTTMLLRILIFMILSSFSTFADDKNINFDEKAIQFAAIIHRHGDRNPMETYPNDPHINYEWPGGMAALTPKGSFQLYTLGRTLRQRYYRLLPTNGFYTAKTMQILSSPRERTLMSSQSFLAGFLPPLVDQNPLPISWQPIAIQSMPRELDYLILQENECAKYDQIYSLLMSNPPTELQIFYKENAQLMTYLTEHSGINVTNVKDALKLWDILFIEKGNNMSLPAWTDSVFPDQLHAMAVSALALPTQTLYMKMVKGGPLVKKIVDQMREKQVNNSNRSIYVYSGHDSTLLSVARLLNLNNQTNGVPAFGATLTFELHCTTSDAICNQLEIRIFYYHSFGDKLPKQLTIPNCPAPCTLDRFTESIDDILRYDYADACKLDDV